MSDVYFFAYGTLKVSETRHHLIKDMPIFTTEIKGYKLFTHPHHLIPAMTPGEGIVRGEVFRINTTLLEVIDFIEGIPDLYQRVKIKILHPKTKQFIEAYTYQKSNISHWTPMSGLVHQWSSSTKSLTQISELELVKQS